MSRTRSLPGWVHRLLCGLVLGVCILMISSHAHAQLIFSFENGLEGDGFTLIQDSNSRTTWIASDMVIDIGDGFTLLAATEGSRRVIPTPWGDRDNFNQPASGDDWTMLLRSPTFELTESGPLVMDIMGGTQQRPGISGPIPQHAGELAGRQFNQEVSPDNASYMMGIALRDALTGEYVLVGWNQLNDTGAEDGNDGKYRGPESNDPIYRGQWNTVTFTADMLAPYVNNGRKYQIDIFDSYGSSSWAWVGFDNLRIPGTLTTPYLPGDTDGDGDIDNTDLGKAFGSFTGPRSPVPFNKFDGLAHADGDFDGDGDVTNTDLGAALGNFTGPNVVVTSTEFSILSNHAAQLIYNPDDGVVTLDATNAPNGRITNFVIKSDGGLLLTDDTTFPTASFFTTNLNIEISWTDGTAVGFEGQHILGKILAAGLTESEFLAAITTATYTGPLGTGGNQPFELVYLPEPASVALVGMGTLLLVRRRRAA